MILKPQARDFKIIGFYLGKIVIGLALFMLLPMIVSLSVGEINPFLDLTIGFLVCLILGLILHIVCYTHDDPNWSHGMTVIALAWLLAAFLAAIPLYLSGHWRSFLDAYFEAMSGFTTSGLTLAQDFGHMSYGHNLWRHLTMFIGGQGIVVVVLSFFVRGMAGAFRLYVGEARDEKVLPNVQQTSQFIWICSTTYLVLGSLVLATIIFIQGMPFLKSLFHGVCIFMAAFDTGGFAPHQQSIIYYHSWAFEIATLVIMVFGAINFKVHYAMWSGNRKEIWRNFEMITLFTSFMILFAFVAYSLARANVYPNAAILFRKGFYQLISGHTGAGHMTIYPDQFLFEWNTLSLVGIMVAMGLGGCASSTTGGIKMIRLGVIFRAFIFDVKHHVSPEKAIIFSKIHHIKDIVLNDKHMHSACLITLAYIAIYFLGGIVGMICGYPMADSFFESISAAGNVGFSCGITNVTMPDLLKMTYILQMWIGRLEFVSVFVLIGFVVALFKGRSK